MEILIPHFLVMSVGMMLGEIIGTVGFARFPENMELALADSVPYPIKAHVNSFGTLLFDSVISNASGSGVISLERGGWLRVPKFFKGNADGASVFSIKEQGTKFSFSGTGKDRAHDLAEDVKGTIIRGRRIISSWQGIEAGAEEVIASGA